MQATKSLKDTRIAVDWTHHYLLILVFRSRGEVPWRFCLNDSASVSDFDPIRIVTSSYIIYGYIKVIANSWGAGSRYTPVRRLHEGWSSEV